MGKVDLEDLPDDLEIQTEVVVHDAVAQSRNSRPRNLRMCGSEIVGYRARGFADDLEIPNDGIDGLLVTHERFAPEPSRIALDLADGREDVLEKESDVPLRHRSARAR